MRYQCLEGVEDGKSSGPQVVRNPNKLMNADLLKKWARDLVLTLFRNAHFHLGVRVHDLYKVDLSEFDPESE